MPTCLHSFIHCGSKMISCNTRLCQTQNFEVTFDTNIYNPWCSLSAVGVVLQIWCLSHCDSLSTYADHCNNFTKVYSRRVLLEKFSTAHHIREPIKQRKSIVPLRVKRGQMNWFMPVNGWYNYLQLNKTYRAWSSPWSHSLITKTSAAVYVFLLLICTISCCYTWLLWPTLYEL